MKRSMLSIILSGVMISAFSQPVSPTACKGLLWQISGNGLSKPSYLYGTMHVSHKVAFHLSDSFFITLRSAEIIGLETDPGKWFEQMLQSNYRNPAYLFDDIERSQNHFSENTFLIQAGNKLLASSLRQVPSVVNGFLYRYRDARQDFEEDTYLDLFIFQAANKLRKPVISVEDFEESEKLASIAEDFAKNERRRYNRQQYALSGNQTHESVYRNGDLDMLDSLNRLSGLPDGYFEHMLFKRNHNMVKCMDSVMRHHSMFVGVGASHLPGNRGMIQMLRNLGYTVRAVSNEGRNSKEKEKIDRLHADFHPVRFTSEDNVFSVETPAALYVFPKENMQQKYLYQDMANGAYYLVTRVKTYATLFGHDMAFTAARIDSLLYENIPGKIIHKKEWVETGYRGFDILNKTTRGHFQRHKIVIMPNEVIFFRIHGTNDYALKKGNAFIKSIVINPLPDHPYKLVTPSGQIEISFPAMPLKNADHSPASVSRYSRSEWIANTSSGATFLLATDAISDIAVMDEDSFELELLLDGLLATVNGSTAVKTHRSFNAIPGLEAEIILPDSSLAYIRMLLWANKTIAMLVKGETKEHAFRFFNSLKLMNGKQGQPVFYRDTAMHFTVKTAALPHFDFRYRSRKKPYESFSHSIRFADQKSGDAVDVQFYRFHKYESEEDSASFWKYRLRKLTQYGKLEIKKHTGTTDNGIYKVDVVLSDTGSTRGIRKMLILKQGVLYALTACTDTSGTGGAFIDTIFASFKPADTLIGFSPLTDKTCLFLDDLLSNDSLLRSQALSSIDNVDLNGENAHAIMMALNNLPQVAERDELKEELIDALADSEDSTVIPFLKKIFLTHEDSANIQVAVLNTLSYIPSKESYMTWKELLLKYTPEVTNTYQASGVFSGISRGDTICNTRNLFPDLFLLLSNEDYKTPLYDLITNLVDSGTITGHSYKQSLNILLTDARKELRKYLAQEQKQARYYYSDDRQLKQLSRLLVPHYSDARVQQYFNKLMLIKRAELKLDIATLMLQFGLPVHDSVFENISAKHEYRQRVYTKLKKINRLDKFPAAQNTNKQRIYGLIYALISDKSFDADTVQLLSEEKTYRKGKQYNVYVFRFKQADQVLWQMGMVGICCNDSTMSICEKDFSSISRQYHHKNLNTTRFLEQEVKYIRTANRNTYRPDDDDLD